MTRSSTSPLLDLDPEIERTLRITRRRLFRNTSNNQNNNMADNRTLKQLAAPDVSNPPLCIQFSANEDDCELKSSLVHLLPKFHGLSGEDPHKHLKEFHVVCSTMKPAGSNEESIKLKAFQFSLVDAAKEWLYYLPPKRVTWDEMKRLFLEKYFPASRTAAIRKSICGIKQMNDETLHDYWERFKRLCASCPQHQISEQLLIQYFYEGLLPMDRSMIDAASGGALMDKTPAAAKDLIANMAANTQQFGATRGTSSRSVNEVQLSSTEHQRLENRLDELTSLVRGLAMMKQAPAKLCGICACPSHPTDACPQLQEDNPEEVAAVNNFPNSSQPRNDQARNNFNPRYNDHPGFRWSNNNTSQQQPFPNRQPFQQAPRQSMQQPQQQQNNPSLEDLVKQMAMQNLQFQQRTDASIQNLEKQVGQMASSISQLQAQGSSKLPSQTIPNPTGNVSAITLRSGKTVEVKNDVKPATASEKSENKEKQSFQSKDEEPSIPLPFPQRVLQTRKAEAEKDKELLETFRKVEVNIPLLDAIKQIPRYAKFLKEMCTHKRRLKGNEKISLGENVSAIIQPMPQKCKDPGTFTIPCTIGNCIFENAMLDLGASINVMPMSIFKSLGLGPLIPTGVVIQLANRSSTYPSGLIEDVLVRVGELIFPADFYILEMEGETTTKVPIILGRPFLKTAKTKIDVHAGTLSLEFGDNIVKFNILDAMKHPREEHSVFHIDLLDDLVDCYAHDHLCIEFPDIHDLDDTINCHSCINNKSECAACTEIENF
ncbi:uncharacterized protein LOC109794285 [Cajanus cajan]|uniref:uncharacterized protein LOC109794285 n=1 Tax=Cajanus cajan TaxID=3821 RepID=UPI0010FAFFE4|nr:uncharacterized protein LOC109794285 [Cajanus cajan]